MNSRGLGMVGPKPNLIVRLIHSVETPRLEWEQ